MENRRRDYRHPLIPQTRLTAELSCGTYPSVYVGEVGNLSVGGIALRFGDHGPVLTLGDTCLVRLAIGEDGTELAIRGAVIWKESRGNVVTYALHFLPLSSPPANEQREKTLWRYLLYQQREQRRRSGELPSPKEP